MGEPPDLGTYPYADPVTGRTAEVPVGIDPGWAYHPGKAWVNPQTRSLEPLG